MLKRAQRQTLLVTPFTYVLICRKITILIPHDQLPYGLVAKLVEQRWSVSTTVGSNHRGQRFFLFLRVGPFPFCG